MTVQTLNTTDLMPGGGLAAERLPGADRASIATRAALVARVAAAHAAAVDREGRFPAEAIAEAKAQRLMSLSIPTQFGGDGAGTGDLADVCYALGQACASSAMIYAMHLTKVACIVRHGGGQPWQDGLMARIAAEQLLLASSTTEGNNGGNVRSSAAAVEHGEAAIELERAATVISYGAQADGLVTTARRADDAAASDQVLVAFLKEDYTLERLSGWDTLGMRGTCSSGFKLRAKGLPEQVLPERYATIHGRTMTPVSHLLWTSVWAGIAANAVERAQGFLRHVSRQAGGQMPPGAGRYGEACTSLRALRALIATALARYEAALDQPQVLDSLDFQTGIAMLKVDASELAVTTVMHAMRACGLSGYRQDGDFSIGRQLRDILSSPIMIHNDRITANVSTATLMAPVPRALRA